MTTPTPTPPGVEAGPFPGGAPDAETFALMNELSGLQTWCVMMSRKDSGGVPAADLIQRTRAFIVERLYPNAVRALAEQRP
jgi:hypothetical protein